MSYLLSSVLHVGEWDITAHNAVDGSWENFNAQLRALGAHGTITEVTAVGDWHDRFDIVRGTVAGVRVTIYSPRYRNIEPQPELRITPQDRESWNTPMRDLVRQVADALKEQKSCGA